MEESLLSKYPDIEKTTANILIWRGISLDEIKITKDKNITEPYVYVSSQNKSLMEKIHKIFLFIQTMIYADLKNYDKKLVSRGLFLDTMPFHKGWHAFRLNIDMFDWLSKNNKQLELQAILEQGKILESKLTSEPKPTLIFIDIHGVLLNYIENVEKNRSTTINTHYLSGINYSIDTMGLQEADKVAELLNILVNKHHCILILNSNSTEAVQNNFIEEFRMGAQRKNIHFPPFPFCSIRDPKYSSYSSEYPSVFIPKDKNSPIVIGFGNNENFKGKEDNRAAFFFAFQIPKTILEPLVKIVIDDGEAVINKALEEGKHAYQVDQTQTLVQILEKILKQLELRNQHQVQTTQNLSQSPFWKNNSNQFTKVEEKHTQPTTVPSNYTSYTSPTHIKYNSSTM